MSLRVEGVVLPLGRTIAPIDQEIGPGISWLRGPNGAGKTTLLRVLCAELTPTAGRVRLDGEDPARSAAARRRITFLPAHAELSGFLTPREAWRTMAALRGRPGWDGEPLAARLGVAPDRPLDHSSVGERRKAELLVALAGDPDVLLLDEVFAPLDQASVATLGALFEEWRSHRIVIVTAHGGVPTEARVWEPFR